MTDSRPPRTKAKLIDLWHKAVADAITSEFEPALDIPHNSVDPAADPTQKQRVYDRMLELLGERPQP